MSALVLASSKWLEFIDVLGEGMKGIFSTN